MNETTKQAISNTFYSQRSLQSLMWREEYLRVMVQELGKDADGTLKKEWLEIIEIINKRECKHKKSQAK